MLFVGFQGGENVSLRFVAFYVALTSPFRVTDGRLEGWRRK